MTIKIDIEKIKEAMIKEGFTWIDEDNLEDWSYSILDALQANYDLETLLINSFKNNS